ncbi:MAG: tetratricopeptide repeat protein [Chloroflexi bacterium]|nr:tetratricopeptide repeat protein [Chloroflexota bacterium]
MLDPATAQLPAKIQGFAWDVYGATLHQAGRYAEALTAYQQAIKVRPDYPDAHYDRGVVLVQLGRHQEALETFQRAIQLRPHFPEAHNNQGVILVQLGHNQEALKAFEKAIKFKAIQLGPDDPAAHNNRSVVLGLLGRYSEALEALENAYPLRRTSSDVGQRIYRASSHMSLLFGLSALKRRWLPDLEAATKAFIKWRARARRDKQLAAFKQAMEEFKEGLSEEEAESFEEFMLGVRLASIRNPFRRWEALGKEISRDWPKDVSAVEAVHEQRRW